MLGIMIIWNEDHTKMLLRSRQVKKYLHEIWNNILKNTFTTFEIKNIYFLKNKCFVIFMGSAL